MQQDKKRYRDHHRTNEIHVPDRESASVALGQVALKCTINEKNPSRVCSNDYDAAPGREKDKEKARHGITSLQVRELQRDEASFLRDSCGPAVNPRLALRCILEIDPIVLRDRIVRQASRPLKDVRASAAAESSAKVNF